MDEAEFRALQDSERAAAFRLDLADALRTLDDPASMMDAATERLGRHLGVAQVGFAEVDGVAAADNKQPNVFTVDVECGNMVVSTGDLQARLDRWVKLQISDSPGKGIALVGVPIDIGAMSHSSSGSTAERPACASTKARCC